MKVTSIRFKLLIWNIGVLAIVLFGFLLVAHVAIRIRMVKTLDLRLAVIANRTQRLFDRPGLLTRRLQNGEGLLQGRNRLQGMPRTFNMQGEPFFLSQLAPTDVIPWDDAALRRALAGRTVTTYVTIDDTPLRVLSRPLWRNGRQAGVVQVAISSAEAALVLDSLTKLLAVLVPIALLVAAAGGIILTNRALEPVRRIVTAASALNPDDLSQRLPVTGDDEFAQLALTMNKMLARIETAFTQLKVSFERERRFTADASHELRTPLTALKANTSLALRGEPTVADYRIALHAADQAADTMTRLVQDLLLLARSDSGQLQLVCEEIMTADLLAEAVALVAQRHPAPHARLDTRADVEVVLGDPHHLQRLLVNLLDNALRHTPAEGVVTVTVARQGQQVIITIADTGSGIAPQHLPHLGERFYRVDAARARDHGGTGLGLAICTSIVDAHHGAMTIDSTPGAGTRVRVTLPGA